MNAALHLLGGMLGGYLVGSIPVAWLLVRHDQRVDLRRVGSGGGGALDVARVAGLRTALLAIVLECLKGAVVGLAARFWLDQGWFVAAAIAGCVVGDAFPAFLGFRRSGRGLLPLVSGLLVALPGAGTLVAIFAIPTAVVTVMRGRSFETVVAVAVPIGLLLQTRQWLSLLPAAVIVLVLVTRQRQRVQRRRLQGGAWRGLGRRRMIVLDHPRPAPEPRGTDITPQ